MEKYKFTNEKIKFIDKRTHILHEIQAVTTIKDSNGNIIAREGDLGGFIEKPQNLSHEGSCWVRDDSIVCGDAQVCDDALVFFSAIVYGGAKVSGHAKVKDRAEISGHAEVTDYAEVSGDAAITDNAKVSGHAKISEMAYVSGNAKISGHAEISGYADVSGNIELDEGSISGYSRLASIKNKDKTEGRGGK